MAFHVYVNRTRRRAMLHREGCGSIKQHGGTAAVADQAWHRCDSEAEARTLLSKAARGFPAAQVRTCSKCW